MPEQAMLHPDSAEAHIDFINHAIASSHHMDIVEDEEHEFGEEDSGEALNLLAASARVDDDEAEVVTIIGNFATDDWQHELKEEEKEDMDLAP